MGLPRRSHFSVAEVAMRWGASMTDMRYVLESGLLQAQVLLAEKLAQIYHRIETPEKEEALVRKALVMIEGFPAPCRQQTPFQSLIAILRAYANPSESFQRLDSQKAPPWLPIASRIIPKLSRNSQPLKKQS